MVTTAGATTSAAQLSISPPNQLVHGLVHSQWLGTQLNTLYRLILARLLFNMCNLLDL
jgi:hypothetical protein